MTADRNATDDHPSHLGRQELVALGRALVTERLESIGCTVDVPDARAGSKLDVRTPSGRTVELFMSTQRVGGYAVWTKRRFQPAEDRVAAVAVLGEGDSPDLYLVPSTEWRDAERPLVDRDNVGKESEPEFGILLSRSSLPALQRYLWDDESARRLFR
jgi:hypothetical protein